MSDQTRERDLDEYYGLKRLKEYLESSMHPLFERADQAQPEILIDDTDYSVYSPDIKSVLKSWDEISNTDDQAHLLVTDIKFSELVGLGELEGGHVDRPVSVLGEGYDLLDIDEGDVRDAVPVWVYEGADAGEPVYTPHKTAITGVHEAGHNLGLKHSDGRIRTENPDITRDIYTSVMGVSYTADIAARQNIEIRPTDSIYWENKFSEDAVKQLARNKNLVENATTGI